MAHPPEVHPFWTVVSIGFPYLYQINWHQLLTPLPIANLDRETVVF